MIIRITSSSNRHTGHYGIVYKKSKTAERHMVLLLKDDDGLPCVKSGFVCDGEFVIIPDEENRDVFDWPLGLCDSTIHTLANDLSALVKDGQKFRKIKLLLLEK